MRTRTVRVSLLTFVRLQANTSGACTQRVGVKSSFLSWVCAWTTVTVPIDERKSANQRRCLRLLNICLFSEVYSNTYVFDIWYRNTSDIVPTAITGDMHSVNKANFGILYCFGRRFEPRFTDLGERLKDLYCADNPALYEKCLVRPVGQIDYRAI